MKRMRVVPTLAFVCAATLSVVAGGDTIHLKDGRVLTGALRATPDGWSITSPNGTTVSVARSQVIKVEISGEARRASGAPSAPDPTGADDKLASLRRAVEAETDLEQVIARFERFAESNPNTPAAEEARREAALCREFRSQKRVKVGARWVTPDEHRAMLARLSVIADEAAALVRSGQWRDAEALVAEILTLDPKQIAGQYLNGLCLFQQDKIIPARKAFESVNAQIASHAPTLNNLAVIAFRQKQWGPAMSFYEQAMQAAPADRAVLDNVAEAIAALSEDKQVRATPVLTRVERAFSQQDSQLAAVMAQQGLFRWGSSWVDKPTIEKLAAEEKRIEQRVSDLQQRLRDRENEVLSIQDRIIATEQSLRRMEADRYTYAVDGTLLLMPLPAAYYEMRRDLEVMRSDRLRAIASVEGAQRDIRAARQELPVPRFTGVQKLIGGEGTPIERPTTQPSSEPATRPS